MSAQRSIQGFSHSKKRGLFPLGQLDQLFPPLSALPSMSLQAAFSQIQPQAQLLRGLSLSSTSWLRRLQQQSVVLATSHQSWTGAHGMIAWTCILYTYVYSNMVCIRVYIYIYTHVNSSFMNLCSMQTHIIIYIHIMHYMCSVSMCARDIFPIFL